MFYRLHNIADLTGRSATVIAKDLIIRYRKRHIIQVEIPPGSKNYSYYGFPTAEKTIFPRSLVEDYLAKVCQKPLPAYIPVSRRPVRNFRNTNDIYSGVVVVLGHFNHGKTSLVDSIINYIYNNSSYLQNNDSKQRGLSDIVSMEKYGITQEVRATTITIKNFNSSLTLIDTPGQEIFYRMRNIGAEIADLGLLVVSATEGLKSQTLESIGKSRFLI